MYIFNFFAKKITNFSQINYIKLIIIYKLIYLYVKKNYV